MISTVMSATRLTAIKKTDWRLQRKAESRPRYLILSKGQQEESSAQQASWGQIPDFRKLRCWAPTWHTLKFRGTLVSEDKPHSCHLWPPLLDLHAVPKVAIDNLEQEFCGSLDFPYTRWVATCLHFSGCSETRCELALADGS